VEADGRLGILTEERRRPRLARRRSERRRLA
jgi:hypothetical protein